MRVRRGAGGSRRSRGRAGGAGVDSGGQQVETEVRRFNGVALIDHQFAVHIVAGHRPGKGEGQQQSKQRENRAFNGTALGGGLST